RATHYYNFATCLRRQRQFEQALKTIDQGLERLPAGAADAALFWQEKAHNLAEMEHGNEAVDCVSKAESLGLNTSMIHCIKGWALGLVGRLEQAREEMKTVLRIEPQNTSAQLGLKKIEGAIGRKPWWKRLFGG